MYNMQTNEIYFPHIIPTATVNGFKHTWSNVNGGSVPIANLNIKQNSFFGGNVTRLGWINEYGMYACQNVYTNEVVGFYVHDPVKLTSLGKEVFSKAFPSHKVVWEIYSEKPFTEEDRRNLEKARAYAMEHGLAPELISHSNASELMTLLATVSSGKAKGAQAELVPTPVEPMETKDVEHIHIENNAILKGRTQPSRAKL